MIQLLYPDGELEPGNYGHLLPEEEQRLICAGLARRVDGWGPVLSHRQIDAFNNAAHMTPDGRWEQFETIDRVYRSSSGIVRTGPCRLMATGCDVAAGTITVYDNIAASGRVVLEPIPLIVGRFPVGTPMGVKLNIGCYVVLSNPAARVFVVAG